MPFTPAHVAAVLPVVGRERPRWAVPSALVIGSMVPDVLYFVPISSHREFSHSLSGVLTLDLALGLLFVGLWRVVAAPVVRDLVPFAVRVRVPVPHRPSAHEWCWASPGVVAGSLTHIVWDAFTHGGGWGVRLLPVLTEPVLGGVPAFKVAQFGSGVVGVVMVLGYGLRVLADARPDHEGSPLATPFERASAWLVLLVVPVVCALAFMVRAMVVGVGTEMLLYVAVVRAVSGLGLAAAAVAVWWHGWVRPYGAPPDAHAAGGPPGPARRRRTSGPAHRRRTSGPCRRPPSVTCEHAPGHRDEHHGRPRRTARLRPASTPHAGHHRPRGRASPGIARDRRCR